MLNTHGIHVSNVNRFIFPALFIQGRFEQYASPINIEYLI